MSILNNWWKETAKREDGVPITPHPVECEHGVAPAAHPGTVKTEKLTPEENEYVIKQAQVKHKYFWEKTLAVVLANGFNQIATYLEKKWGKK